MLGGSKMTEDELFESRLKALKDMAKKVKKSKKEALKFLVAAGIMDKKGNIMPRYKRSYE
jgi:hypothetical protein